MFPLDFFIDHPARHMAPAVGHSMPPEGCQALADMQGVISKHCAEVQLAPVDRFEFYEEARRSFAVVRACSCCDHVLCSFCVFYQLYY